MKQIHILDAADEPRSFATQNGSMTSQSIRLRELTGDSEYTRKILVDNVSGKDLRKFIGSPIACKIENRVTKTKEGREFNNLQVREVVVLATAEPF